MTREEVSFGALLKRYRRAAGLTQEALAERAGLSARSVSDLERGLQRRPYRETVRRLADALQLCAAEREALGAAAGRHEDGAAETWPTPRLSLADEVPLAGTLYGRVEELATLQSWTGGAGCRVVAITGMGGMGKTSLVAHLAQRLAGQFSSLIWQSMLNAPPLDDVIRHCMSVLEPRQSISLPPSLDDRLALLFEELRRQRCLLVLDNLESILDPQRSGRYRAGYEVYRQLIELVGRRGHQSCLLLTAREAPLEVSLMQRGDAPVRMLHLRGVDQATGQQILLAHGVMGSDDEARALVDRYSGSPLALRLVADTIHDLFAGQIALFLAVEAPVFDDIRDVLDQQIARLTPLEREVMTWLAIERVPVTFQTLQSDLVVPRPPRTVLETVRSLQRRSLLEQRGDAYTLPNVLIEYLTDRLIDEIGEEIEREAPRLLSRHSLLKAQAPEDIRQSQVRQILDPIARRSADTLGLDGLDAASRRILDALRAEVPRAASYAAANLLNLLVHLDYPTRAVDCSRLSVRQAYLVNTLLPEVDFGGADLTDSVFTDAFGAVHAVAFSPDGALLAAGTDTGAVRIWRVADSRSAAICSGHSSFVWCVAFGPDGRMVASGGEDHTVRLWDGHSGEQLAALQGHTSWVRSVAFSPDSHLLASGSGDCTVRLWDIQSGAVSLILQGHTAPVRCVSFSSNGEHLATASEDCTVRVWEVRSGKLVHTLEGHAGPVRSVAFSPDRSCLVSGGNDRAICVWEPDSGRLLRVLEGHADRVKSIAFSPDGKYLVSGSDDRTVRLWDVRGGKAAQVLLGHTSRVESVAWSPAGALVASSGNDQTVRLWDARNGHTFSVLQGYSSAIYSVMVSPDGTTLASGGSDRMVRLWDLETRQLLQSFHPQTSAIYSLAFSPDGTLLASRDDRTIHLWHVATGELSRTLRGHISWVRSVAFSPDGAFLASGGNDQTVRVWNVSSGETPQVLRGHIGRVESVAFSLDSRVLASGSGDATIRLWDTRSGQVLAILRGHSSPVRSVALSQNGAILASGSEDRTIRLWDTKTGETICVLDAHGDTVGSVAFSPEGRYLASGSDDQTVRLWEAATGQPVRVLRGHTSWVRAVAFSPDGAVLVSGGDDENLKLWNVCTGACVETLRAPGPYAGMNIGGATGLTDAQRVALKTLGAVERAPEAAETLLFSRRRARKAAQQA